MRFEEHVEHTKKLFGISGKEIHHWIDAFYDRKKVEKLAGSNAVAFNPYDHRRYRHHREALPEVLKEFEGTYPEDVIRAVFEQHLKDDYDGYLPNKADFVDPDFIERYHKRFPSTVTEEHERLKQRQHRRDRIQFFWRFILPSLLVLISVAGTISLLAVPLFREQLIDQKKAAIRELTLESEQILQYWHDRYLNGALTEQEAMDKAIDQLRGIRYGDDRKDYFWVTDLQPVMIMHPYLPELEGQDLSDYRDPDGKLLFVETVEAVKDGGAGYVEYRWQWQDDEERVVPKLSHVRLFEPWNFIVGTGVYIEDIEQELRTVTRRIIMVTVVLIIMLTIIMIFLSAQSYRLELKRREAVDSVFESQLRYKALVESSEEGLIMVLEGRQVYSNRVITDMLGYGREEFGILDLHEFLFDIGGKEVSGVERFRELMTGSHAVKNLEATLKKKSGELLRVRVSISTVEIGEKPGFLLSIRDVSEHHEVLEKLDISEDRIRILTENIGIGVFRLYLGTEPAVHEPNAACLDILGFRTSEELNEHGFLSLFNNDDEKQRLLKALRKGDFIQSRLISFRRNDGATRVVSLTMLPLKTSTQWYDAIMEDLTTQREHDRQRHNLLDEIQAATHSMNQPVGDVAKEVPTVSMNTTIGVGAEKMTRSDSNALLIVSETKDLIGIVTDKDLRRRVLAPGLSIDEPIFKIMSSPVIRIDAASHVFEAAMLMQKHGIFHLAVLKDNELLIFSSEELLQLQRNSHLYFLRQIERAEDKTELLEYHKDYRRLVEAMVPGGGNALTVSRFLTGGADAVAKKIIDLVLAEMEEPPCPFSFIQMGSWGRQELSLINDQDNAIIFAGSGGEEKAFFLEFGKKVCTLFDQFGYTFCKGGNMAMNPQWVRPLSEWKELFYNWIVKPEPNEVLKIMIFFDFRSIYGDAGLSDDLRRSILKEAPERPVFLWNLAQGCVNYKVRAALEGDSFDVKQSLRPVVDYARLQALKHGISSTNTLERLHSLYEKGTLDSRQHRSASQVFEYLSQMRLRHQYKQKEKGYPPDNSIVLADLSEIDRDSLHRLLDQTQTLQNWVKREFRDLI